MKAVQLSASNGQTNYEYKLISWFELSLAVALSEHRVWLLKLNVHVLGRYTRDYVNEWDWVYGNEINVLLLLGTALWIPMRANMVSVVMTARIYILSVSQASNVDLWRCATHGSTDILSSYRQIWDESPCKHFKDGIWENCGHAFAFSAAPPGHAAIVSSILFPLLSHLLNADETMLTHKLSFVRPELN